MAAATVAVPAASARNIGQSSPSAGAVEAGAAHAGDWAGAIGSFSAVRGAMEKVPCTCQQSQASGIQYNRPLAGTTPSKHPGRTTPSYSASLRAPMSTYTVLPSPPPGR